MKRMLFRGLDPEGVPDGNYVLTVAGGRVTGLTAATPGGGGGAIAVDDEGTEIIAAASRLNFTGAGVTVADAGSGEATISIPGGGGGGGSVVDTTVSRSLTAQTPSTGAWTDVIWDTEEHDPLGAWSSGASLIVPSGITRAKLTAAIAWSNVGSGSRYVRLYNATTDATYGGDIRGAVNESLSTVSTPWVPVAAGNDLRLRVLTNAGASIQGTSFGGPTRLTVEWA